MIAMFEDIPLWPISFTTEKLSNKALDYTTKMREIDKKRLAKQVALGAISGYIGVKYGPKIYKSITDNNH